MVAYVPLNSGVAPYFITHVATAGEATANAVVLATGFSTAPGNLAGVLGYIVQIYRADVQVTADADISLSATHDELTVADGAATYAVTAGDVINVVVWGTRY